MDKTLWLTFWATLYIKQMKYFWTSKSLRLISTVKVTQASRSSDTY